MATTDGKLSTTERVVKSKFHNVRSLLRFPSPAMIVMSAIIISINARTLVLSKFSARETGLPVLRFDYIRRFSLNSCLPLQNFAF